MQQGGESSLGHVIKYEHFPSVGHHVAGAESYKVRVPDLAQHRGVCLELLVALGILPRQPLDGHHAAILQRLLVRCPRTTIYHRLLVVATLKYMHKGIMSITST